MKEEFFKEEMNTHAQAEDVYEQYQRMGGIINKKDYENACEKSRNPAALDVDPVVKKEIIAQTELISIHSGIELHNTKDAIDPRVLLFGILRHNIKPENVNHNGQMGDQQLFAEVLRILGDAESLNKLIKTHPNISFN